MPSNRRQRMAIKSMVNQGNLDSVVEYLSSLMGNRRYLSIERHASNGTDKLADKSPGSVKALFDRMIDTNRSHKPIDGNQDWFGVEIECIVPYESLNLGEDECPRCNGTGLVNDGEDECCRCDGSGLIPLSESSAREGLAEIFKSKGVKFSSIKDDGSIRDDEGFFSVEITVLSRLSNTENLKRVCSILNTLGAKVNRSCGMHVHLDARHMTAIDVKRVGKTFEKALPVMLSMVPESRRTNTYCRPSVSAIRGQRYHAVNLTAFSKYRTIEIRLHSSTTDFDKIMNWVRIVDSISKATIKRTCQSINDLTDWVKLDENLVEYMGQRTALFNDEACTQSCQDSDSTEQVGA